VNKSLSIGTLFASNYNSPLANLQTDQNKKKKKETKPAKETKENIYKYFDSDRADVATNHNNNEAVEEDILQLKSKSGKKQEKEEEEEEEVLVIEGGVPAVDDDDQNEEINLKLNCIKPLSRPTPPASSHHHPNGTGRGNRTSSIVNGEAPIQLNFEYTYLVNNIFEW
jgi:hypothetical protein